jgi:hypothetical protein
MIDDEGLVGARPVFTLIYTEAAMATAVLR